MGNTASKFIVNTSRDIREIRGKIYKYNGIVVIPTFHPSYLLRDQDAKKLVWEDFKKVRDFLKI